MGLLLFLVASAFILYNLVINLTNLVKIITYCFDTNSVDDYWSLFYEACFHGRAIYSSIIISIIGFFVFIIILPIVLIKGIFTEGKIERKENSGAIFKYSDTELTDKKFVFTNIEELGIERFETSATGNVNLDFTLILSYIFQGCEAKNLKPIRNVMETYDMSNEMSVVIPLTIEISQKVYPVYLIYTEKHKESYFKINPVLKANNFENAIYFSILPII